METLVEIIKGNRAVMSHVCNGKAYFIIETTNNKYQLELDSTDGDWKTTHMQTEYAAITLMRWIRRGIDENDGTFISLYE
jgi:hypothetical protein